MWPHFKAVQRSKIIDAFENVQKRKGHQSGDDLFPKILPRATCSLPARRISSNPHMSNMHSGDYGKFESQGSSSYRGENFTQHKDENSKDNIPGSKDVLLTEEKQTLQPFGFYRPPLQENSPYCGDRAFRKYFPDKQQRCTDSKDSLGFKMKRKHSTSLFSFTNDELQPSRKKHAAATDSPRTLSDSYDPTKPINFQSNSANKYNTFLGETAAFLNSGKSFEENHNFGSLSTPLVQNYPSPDDIGRNPKENLPSPFLSPESLELPKETMSSPESVCERMALNKDLMDEDDDVQSQFSPTMDSFSQEAPIHVPMSPLYRNDWDYSTDFSQLQPVQTDPDEEYEKLMCGPREKEGIHHHDFLL